MSTLPAATFIHAQHGIRPRGPMDPEVSYDFSEDSRNTLIATTVIGGTFVVALLIYVIYKRRKGATYAQILHVPPRSHTPQLTPTPMRERFLKHPIYHDIDYSIRSSKHNSTTTFPPRARLNTSTSTGGPKHQRIKSGWQDPDLPPKTPTKDPELPRLPDESTFLFDESPREKPRAPEKAHVSVRSISEVSRNSSIRKQSLVADTSASRDQISNGYISPLDSPPALDHGPDRWSWTNSQAPPTPRLQPQPPFASDETPDRWSWTNSQAPSTPRLNPSSRRASLMSAKYSAPRFRSVVSWARGQGEHIRIDEEAPPLLPPPTPQPMIQPAPTNKRAFKDSSPPDLSRKNINKSKGTVKSHMKAKSSLGNLGGLFKAASNSKSTTNVLSKTPGKPVSDIELKDRQRSS